ncbi:hypothetical protein OROMI_019177 [Orobanche minor]
MSSSGARSSVGRRSSSMVTLGSSDGQTMVVEKSAAMISIMLKNIIENNYDGHVIDVRVEGRILMKVVEYCKAHAVGSNVSKLNAFDDDFINVEPDVLFDLVTACANTVLNIKSLQNLTQRRFSELMRGKPAGEVRRILDAVKSYYNNKRGEGIEGDSARGEGSKASDKRKRILELELEHVPHNRRVKKKNFGSDKYDTLMETWSQSMKADRYKSTLLKQLIQSKRSTLLGNAWINLINYLESAKHLTTKHFGSLLVLIGGRFLCI